MYIYCIKGVILRVSFKTPEAEKRLEAVCNRGAAFKRSLEWWTHSVSIKCTLFVVSVSRWQSFAIYRECVCRALEITVEVKRVRQDCVFNQIYEILWNLTLTLSQSSDPCRAEFDNVPWDEVCEELLLPQTQWLPQEERENSPGKQNPIQLKEYYPKVGNDTETSDPPFWAFYSEKDVPLILRNFRTISHSLPCNKFWTLSQYS